jgi:hypothetical protein
MLLTVPERKEMSGKELYDFFHSPFLQVVLGDKIKQGKQKDPDKIDQMPV